ncbi:MAG: hypothetical protein HXS54_17670 [Theionarchaea archaeon]|nr:hypothetical protein [Theionarchaea archaeon]
MENKEALEEEHSGKYIAVHEERIVATGKTVHEVYVVVKELKIENPLVTYMPRENEEAFLI